MSHLLLSNIFSYLHLFNYRTHFFLKVAFRCP